MARLRVATGRSAGKVVDVEKNAVIGRGEAAELQIADIKASREHCRVFDQGGTWAVADLNSRNGIKVNGVVTTRKLLAHGDKIEIGDTVVVFEISTTAETGDLAPKKKDPGATETGDLPQVPAAAPAKPAAAKPAPAKPAPAKAVPAKSSAAETGDMPAVKAPPPARPGAAAKPSPAAKAPAAKATAAPAPKSASTAKAAAMASARADAAKAKSVQRTKSAAPVAERSGGTKGEGLEVSDRVLQFHKVDPKKATVMDVDLTQSPGMTKFLIILGCAAFLGILAWIFSTLVET